MNAERAAGFPNGRLFLDSIEQVLAVALVNGYAVRRPSPQIYRGGLTPARLRRVTELVEAKIDDDLSLEEMAESSHHRPSFSSQMPDDPAQSRTSRHNPVFQSWFHDGC